LTFTVDRYLMICHPFIAKRWCTLRRSKVVIASIFFTSFCYSLPRFYELSHMGVSDSFRLGLKTRRHETDVMLIGVIVIFFVCQVSSWKFIFRIILNGHLQWLSTFKERQSVDFLLEVLHDATSMFKMTVVNSLQFFNLEKDPNLGRGLRKGVRL
uniref:G_PROTEIN_RECEP_F1_2 domain-containing protein n=1 Tax=Hymenolepis diminuta TaxID=6216 RepID=A0A0R3S9G6_HYMDI